MALLFFSVESLTQEVPVFYQNTYDEIEAKLQQIDHSLNQKWDGTLHPTRFCSDVSICNTQIQKTELLTPGYYVLTIQMLDALVEMGMTAVRFNFSYPFLVNDFPDADRYLDLFQRIVQAARDRNLTVFIKCTSTNTNPDYGSSDPTIIAFMQGLTAERYKSEKKQMLVTILRELRPDFLTIEDEPETMQEATGLEYSPDILVEFIQHFLDGLDKGECLIGAGVGSWEPLEYVDRLVDISDLDYLDIHVYPVNFDFVDDNLFYICGKAENSDKKLVFGECWLHKTSNQDILAQLIPPERFKRDMFGFWYPLDSTYTRMLADFAHYSRAEIVALYWTSLFFNYLNYQPGYENLSCDSLSSLTVPQALQNMNDGILSPIGQYYREIIREAQNNSNVTMQSNGINPPLYFELYDNYPNPFNPETTIPFHMNSSDFLQIRIYNTLGQEVKTLIDYFMPAGRHKVMWNGTNDYERPMGSGVYICLMQIGKSTVKKKMILMR